MATTRKDATQFSTSTTPLLAFLLFSLQIAPWILVWAHDLAPNATDDRLPSLFLKDVVRAVAAKERWDPEAVRVSRLNGGKVKVGRSQRYVLHMRAAERIWVLGVPGGNASWKGLKGRGRAGGFGPELFTGIGRRRRALRAFELEGPLELRSAGDGELSLLLPMNATHRGIKRVIVGEGMKVKIKRAFEVSIIVPNDLRLLVSRSLVANEEYKHQLWAQEHPSCRQLLAVYIQGLASITAYRIRDSKASIQTVFHSPDMLELLPEKCFNKGYFRCRPLDILSLGSRLELVEKILSFLGNKIMKNDIPHFIKVKITSATLVKFRMEMEREIDHEDRDREKTAQWKTKPLVERAQFEIIARVEGSKQFKPVAIKKLKKLFVVAEITSWSSLMSNLSSSRFLSNVVPPEPLTLDVKW